MRLNVAGKVMDLDDEILTYLREHSSAADTLDGIAEWWLPRQRYEQGKAQIKSVLDQLVAEGRVRCINLSDGTMIYSIADERNKENRQF
jgi:Fe2+ or Zn2+ uptake regulation protein